MSYMQRQRRAIIQQMMIWIDEKKEFNKGVFLEKDEIEVLRLAMLKYGCTRERAKEYMDVIFFR